LPAETAEERAAQERQGRLFRQSLRTLYLTGRFLDLSSDLQTSPHVQARVAAAQPEMDEAVLGMTAMLESLGPEDHRRIQDTLKRNPDIGERLAAMLDETAKEDGIPFQRRMSLRTSTLQLAAKMTAQSPALTVDPYVRRVRRIEARPHSPTEHERVLASRVGEEAFWEHQRKLADLQKRWSQKLAQAGSPSPTAPKAPAATPAPAPPPQSRGSSVIGTGGKIMGFGAGSVAVGLICAGLVHLGADAFLWPALFFGVTLGPILLVIGLIIVIVGAIMKATE